MKTTTKILLSSIFALASLSTTLNASGYLLTPVVEDDSGVEVTEGFAIGVQADEQFSAPMLKTIWEPIIQRVDVGDLKALSAVNRQLNDLITSDFKCAHLIYFYDKFEATEIFNDDPHGAAVKLFGEYKGEYEALLERVAKASLNSWVLSRQFFVTLKKFFPINKKGSFMKR